MTEQQLELQEYASLRDGDKVTFYFKDGTACTGIVINEVETKYDADGRYFELKVQIKFNNYMTINSRQVDRMAKVPSWYLSEDNSIIGKNWLSNDYGIDKNLGDKEFARQLLEKWSSLDEGDKYIISDMMAISFHGKTFKLFMDTASQKQQELKNELSELDNKYSATKQAAGVGIGTAALLGTAAGYVIGAAKEQ